MTKFRRALVLTTLMLSASLVPDLALACGVCYGDPDSPMTEGMNNGILVLLGFVGIVQVGFVALFWNFRKRAKEHTRKDDFRLIAGGKDEH